MFQIKLAEKVIRIHNHYSYVEKLCSGYLVSDAVAFDLEIEIPEENIQQERDKAEERFSLAYCESICIYREISLKLLNFGTMVLHGAVIDCEGKGIAFLARSGTGKSTHIRLWKQLWGERVTIINGDKPLISYKEDSGEFIAYGTPWCGKENWGCNSRTVLHAVCFLVRGPKNRIRPMDSSEVVMKIFHQLLVPVEEKLLSQEMDLVDLLLERISFFELTCNMETEAAEAAYHAMIGKGGAL